MQELLSGSCWSCYQVMQELLSGLAGAVYQGHAGAVIRSCRSCYQFMQELLSGHAGAVVSCCSAELTPFIFGVNFFFFPHL